MGSILKATLVLGSGSVVSLLAGFVSNKAYAVLVGPEGVGLLGLLQSLLGVSALLAGVGLSSGLVRLGAALASQSDIVMLAALRQAAWQIYALFSGAVTLLLLLSSQPIARIMLETSSPWIVVTVVIAMLLSSAAGVQIGLLNAHHRVSLIARVTAMSSVLGAAWGIALVWVWREAALPWVLLGIPAAQLALSSHFSRWISLSNGHPNPEKVRDARLHLLRFGLPYTMSQLLGTGTQLILPFLISLQVSQAEVGFYRAAIILSTLHVSVTTSVLAQDYFPRVSKLVNQDELTRLLNQQLKTLLLIFIPVVLCMLLFRDVLIQLAFSEEFKPASKIIVWLMPADLLRLSSWVLAIVVMARLSPRTYMLVEFFGGASLLVSVWLFLSISHLEGIGLGFFLAYALYLSVLTAVLVSSLRVSVSWDNWGWLVMGVASTLLVVNVRVEFGAAVVLAFVVTSLVKVMPQWRRFR